MCVDWIHEDMTNDEKNLVQCLYDLGIICPPKTVGAIYGAILASKTKAETLKRLLELLERP